ncbi:MAG TPA: response regulator [Candidatus Nitrosocosmicus sp.]
MDLSDNSISDYTNRKNPKNNDNFNLPDKNDVNSQYRANQEKYNQITFINYTHQYCICIVDIVDSTKITQQLLADSNKIRSYYSIFLNTMASIINDYNGKVIKNAGDCLIYYFPKTVDTDTNKDDVFQDVLDCGLAMIDVNIDLNNNLKKNDLPSINYRISANYGKLEMAASLNSHSVDLFGPAINICSKINHLALPNEMVIYKDLYYAINKTSFFEDYYFQNIVNRYGKTEILNENENSISYEVFTVQRYNNPEHQKEIESKKKKKLIKLKENRLSQSNSSFNILLIDDDPDILFTFKTIIEGEDYKTISFSDPKKALEHFAQVTPYHYDLIIMDIRMPGLNGIQLYSKMKIMNPDIKVFFLSALDAIEEILSIFPDVKISDIIKKPIEPQMLVIKVKEILTKVQNR